MLLGRPFTLTLSLRIVLTRGNCSGQQRNFCLWRRSYASLIILTKLSSSTTLLIFLWVRSIQFAQTLMLWAYRAWKKVPEDFEIGPRKVLSFKPLTKIAIRKLIQSSAKKSCALDPMPNPLVVSCLDVLLPVITTIVNSSLLHGHFPSNWKETIVTPILKNPAWHLNSPNLDPLVTYSLSQIDWACRLWSATNSHVGPHFISLTTICLQKIAQQWDSVNKSSEWHLDEHGQSASNSTCITRSQCRVRHHNHRVLLNRLRLSFGIRGYALEWIASYLSDRTRLVSFENNFSQSRYLSFGVPQGSCLGPLLFTVFAS